MSFIVGNLEMFTTYSGYQQIKVFSFSVLILIFRNSKKSEYINHIVV